MSRIDTTLAEGADYSEQLEILDAGSVLHWAVHSSGAPCTMQLLAVDNSVAAEAAWPAHAGGEPAEGQLDAPTPGRYLLKVTAAGETTLSARVRLVCESRAERDMLVMGSRLWVMVWGFLDQREVMTSCYVNKAWYELMPRALTSLSLSAAGAAAVLRSESAFSRFRNVTEIVGVKLGDQGVTDLSEALIQGCFQNVQDFKLARNGIGPDGAVALARAIIIGNGGDPAILDEELAKEEAEGGQ